MASKSQEDFWMPNAENSNSGTRRRLERKQSQNVNYMEMFSSEEDCLQTPDKMVLNSRAYKQPQKTKGAETLNSDEEVCLKTPNIRRCTRKQSQNVKEGVGTRRRLERKQSQNVKYTEMFSSDEDCLQTPDKMVLNSRAYKQSQKTKGADEEVCLKTPNVRRCTRKQSQKVKDSADEEGVSTQTTHKKSSGTRQRSARMQSQMSSDDDEDLWGQRTRRSSRTTSQRSTCSESQSVKDVEIDHFFNSVHRTIELHKFTIQTLDKKQISFLMGELDNIPNLLKGGKHLIAEVSKLKKELLSINNKLDLAPSTLGVGSAKTMVGNLKRNLYDVNTASSSLENFDLSLLTNNDFVTPTTASKDNKFCEYSQHFSVNPNRNQAKILQNIKLCSKQFKSENLFDSQPALSGEIYPETPAESFSPKSEVFQICSEVKNLDIGKTIIRTPQEVAASSQDKNVNLSDAIQKLGSDTELQENINEIESNNTYKGNAESDDNRTVVDMEIEDDRNDAEDKHMLVHKKLRNLAKKPDLDDSDFVEVIDDLYLLIQDLQGELQTKFKEKFAETADETVKKPNAKATSKSLFPEAKDKSSIIVKSGEKITEEDYEEMVRKLTAFYTSPGNKLFEIKQEVPEMPDWEDFDSFN